MSRVVGYLEINYSYLAFKGTSTREIIKNFRKDAMAQAQTEESKAVRGAGPKMALAYRLDAISQGPKNSRIPGPNPLPLALVMDMHASKTLCTGLYKS